MANISFSNKRVNYFLFTLPAIQNYILTKMYHRKSKSKRKNKFTVLSVISFFWLCFLSFVHFQYLSILKKKQYEKVQHENNRAVARNPARWRSLQQCRSNHRRCSALKACNFIKRDPGAGVFL